MIVLTAENGTVSFALSVAHSSGEVERSVKYTAKMPAKNITSLPSHTMVPTCTTFGRFRLGAGGLASVALVTRPL